MVERIVRMGNTQKLVLLGGCLLTSLFCCLPLTWYTASGYGARGERERIANELKKDLGHGLKNAFGEVEGEQIGNTITKNYADEFKKAWRDAFHPRGKANEDLDTILEVSYEKPAEIDDMEIRLIEGAIGRFRIVNAFGGKERGSEKMYIQIKFKITNKTDSFLFEYHGARAALASDEFGNKYVQWFELGGSYVKGGTERSLVRVDPAQSVVDIIAFETPIAKATEIWFEVPGTVLGRPPGKRVLFKIPRTWFKAVSPEESKVKKPSNTLELSYDKPAEIDKMKIELVSGTLGKLTLLTAFDKREFQTEKEYLQIKYRITNLTDSHVYHHGKYIRHFVLKDEFGNEYSESRHTRIKGGTDMARVDPGQSVVGVLAFELPIAKATELFLEFPGRNIDRPSGPNVVFRIPRTWFK